MWSISHELLCDGWGTVWWFYLAWLRIKNLVFTDNVMYQQYVNFQLSELKTMKGDLCQHTCTFANHYPQIIRGGLTTRKDTKFCPTSLFVMVEEQSGDAMNFSSLRLELTYNASTVCKLNYWIEKINEARGGDRKAWYCYPYRLREQMKQE